MIHKNDKNDIPSYQLWKQMDKIPVQKLHSEPDKKMTLFNKHEHIPL